MFETHELLIFISLFFVGASLLLYVVLGGADYGAGILELLPSGSKRDRQEEIINKAMGPVWEANHMWLIIVVVILFIGFPQVFNTLMVSLHMPVVALLVGIVIRGSVFTFRHYDALPDKFTQKLYTWLFAGSSLWTSMWFGIIAASLYRGKIDTETTDFWTAYMAPWWGLFPVTMGLFVVFIFAFLAAIYLIGETKDAEMKKFFSQRAFVLNILVILSGATAFAASEYEGGHLFTDFMAEPLAIACMICATWFFGVLWMMIRKRRSYMARVVAAGQGALILFGWFFVYAPNAMITKTGHVSFFEAAAPTAALYQLVLALLIGSVFIFPSLFYLLKVFKNEIQA